MNKIKKLCQLMESLLVEGKEIGLNNLSEKSKIIFSYPSNNKKILKTYHHEY